MTGVMQLKFSFGKGISAALGCAASRKPGGLRRAARSRVPPRRVGEDGCGARTGPNYATVGGDRFWRGMKLDD